MTDTPVDLYSLLGFEQEEQKFLDTLRSPSFNNNYFSFKTDYKDKLIHQLVEKNNDLQDKMNEMQGNYELKIKKLEASLEAMKDLCANKQKIEELEKQNSELSNNKQLLKGKIIQELQILKGIACSQFQLSDNTKIKQSVENFVQNTIQLDEKYYQLLSKLDEKYLNKEMSALEQLNKS
ncbi:hypothetical protein pb186bvf_005024 [Paramecium bursaria]